MAVGWDTVLMLITCSLVAQLQATDSIIEQSDERQSDGDQLQRDVLQLNEEDGLMINNNI